jgi:hypothetical protein
MSDFKIIRTGDDVIDRVQQNVALAFREARNTVSVGTADKAEFRVSDESYVFADSRRQPVIVVLPESADHEVVVKNTTTSGNSVTVRVVNGSKIDNSTSLPLLPLVAARLRSNAGQWWVVQ